MLSEGVKRPSMLEARLEIQRISTKPQKQLVHSVAIVSKPSPRVADKRDIGIHYEKVFKACSSKYQGDGPTGILLVYPQHCVHLLEAPIEIINTVVSDLKELQTTGDLIQACRILNFSNSLSARFYPQWCYRVLSMSSLSKGEVYQTNDSIELTVTSALEKLYRLGAHLTKQHQLEMRRTLDSLTDKVPQLLPQQDVLEYLSVHPELSTAEEFLRHYCTPPNVILDTETVWPLPIRLFPYD